MKGRIRDLLNNRWGRCIMAAMLALMLVGFSTNGSVYATSLSSGQVGVVANTVMAPAGATYKWIDVNLSTQMMRAYAGNTLVYSSRISSGVSRYPTVQGTFHVYSKLRYTRMRGGVGRDHYDLPNVPNVMYFYAGYALHGAYWHNNFGHPMSHGCVNLPLGMAATLFNWTPMGTTVRVHR